MAITYKTFTKVFIKEFNRVIEESIEDGEIPESTYAKIKGSSNRGEEELLVIECEINGESTSVETPMSYLYHLYCYHDIAILDMVFYILEQFTKGIVQIYIKIGKNL